MVDYVAKCMSCGPNGSIAKSEKDGKITYSCALGKDDCTAAMTFNGLYEDQDMPVIEEKSNYLRTKSSKKSRSQA